MISTEPSRGGYSRQMKGERKMKQFEVGKTYEAYDCGIDPVKVLRRMPKTLEVTNGFATWRMRIDHDWKGNEVVVDKSVPRRHRY